MTDVTMRSAQSLRYAPAMTVLSTTDVERSRAFYTEKLGLKAGKIDEDARGFELAAGEGSRIYIYWREEPPSATNTAAGFAVEDVDACVAALRARGVEFEEYDLPGLKTKNGVATLESGEKSAWFKDPDGNILAVADRT